MLKFEISLQNCEDKYKSFIDFREGVKNLDIDQETLVILEDTKKDEYQSKLNQKHQFLEQVQLKIDELDAMKKKRAVAIDAENEAIKSIEQLISEGAKHKAQDLLPKIELLLDEKAKLIETLEGMEDLEEKKLKEQLEEEKRQQELKKAQEEQKRREDEQLKDKMERAMKQKLAEEEQEAAAAKEKKEAEEKEQQEKLKKVEEGIKKKLTEVQEQEESTLQGKVAANLKEKIAEEQQKQEEQEPSLKEAITSHLKEKIEQEKEQ